MKTSLRRTVCLFLALIVALAASAAYGQGYGQGQQTPPKPPTQPGQPAGVTPDAPAPAVNAEEEAAYKTFYETKNSEFRTQIQLGEEFLKKYPESRYREGVYSRLTSAYLSAGQEDKMFSAGEKALELNPNNVDVLALMTLVMPRRVDPRTLDADQKLQKSERYSNQAIGLLATMEKPANMADEDFARAKNEKLSMCHSGLGLVQFHRQKFAESAAELEQATKLASNPDPVDFYVLGLAYQNISRYADSAVALGHCAESAGPLQERCKQGMEQAKRLAATQPSAPKK